MERTKKKSDLFFLVSFPATVIIVWLLYQTQLSYKKRYKEVFSFEIDDFELLETESVKTAILGFLDILDVVAKELNWQKYFNVNCKWSIWKIECAYCIDADTINRKKVVNSYF